MKKRVYCRSIDSPLHVKDKRALIGLKLIISRSFIEVHRSLLHVAIISFLTKIISHFCTLWPSCGNKCNDNYNRVT